MRKNPEQAATNCVLRTWRWTVTSSASLRRLAISACLKCEESIRNAGTEWHAKGHLAAGPSGSGFAWRPETLHHQASGGPTTSQPATPNQPSNQPTNQQATANQQQPIDIRQPPSNQATKQPVNNQPATRQHTNQRPPTNKHQSTDNLVSI